MTTESPPTVGDLFCGAGGFSEGFRQAGFKIVWALDNWIAARDTFESNFPDAKLIPKDISEVDLNELEPVDVLLGGPPCTYFSLANKAGNGEKEEGFKLITRFVEAVKTLAPRYWIMENVSNLNRILQRARDIPDSPLGKWGGLTAHFPQRAVLNSADFGVPQTRRRLFSGRFPLPQPVIQDRSDWIAMGKVTSALPFPLTDEKRIKDKLVEDPLYRFRIRCSSLRDHFLDTRLEDWQREMCVRGKLRHPWGGPMRFPDSPDLPSRTILATPIKSNRGTIVIRDVRASPPVFRTLTIRESACIQGFPISFQFWGGNVNRNQALVGNAVPPPVARALAMEIRRELGMRRHYNRRFRIPKVLPPTYSYSSTRARRSYPFGLFRHFRRSVMGTTRYQCSIDLDNRGQNPTKHPAGVSRHLVEWQATLYLGYAKDYVSFRVNLNTAFQVALRASSHSSERSLGILEQVISMASSEFSQKIPDASTLQAIWATRIRNGVGPDWVVNKVETICKQLLPKLGNPPAETLGLEIAPLLTNLRLSSGKLSRRGKWKSKRISFYGACSLVALSIAAAFANHGHLWLRSNWGHHYSGEKLDLPRSLPQDMAGLVAENVVEAFHEAVRLNRPRA